MIGSLAYADPSPSRTGNHSEWFIDCGRVGQMRKWAKWAAIAFTIWFVISRPDNAAAVVGNMMDGLSHAAESLSRFVSALP